MVIRHSPSHVEQEPNSGSRRFGPLSIIKFCLGLLLLTALYRLGVIRLEPLKFLLERYWFLSAIVLLVWLTYPLCVWRWHILLEMQGIRASGLEVFRVLYSAAFAGLFLPGVIGGDAVRVALGISLSPKQKTGLALSIFVDRLSGVLGLLTLGLAAAIFLVGRGGGPSEVRMLLLSVVCTFLGVLIFIIATGLLSKKLQEANKRTNWEQRTLPWQLAKKLIDAVDLFRGRPGRLALCWGISVLVHGKNLIVLVLLAKGMDMGDMGATVCALAGAVTFLVNFLPLTPGGLGIGEAAFAQTISWLVPAAVPLAYGTVVLVYRAVTVVSLLPAPLMTPSQIWVRR